MPPRRLDPQRLLSAANGQRAVLGMAEWAGAVTIGALGRACAEAVIAAADAGLEPLQEALRGAVIHTLDLLAQTAPGRAVEVRVPPFAAVQAVAGPRHSRGTPPNVVEVDPLAWVLLAAGRIDWAAAVGSGAVRASGPRSDLAVYLPLVEGAGSARMTGQDP